MVNLTANYRVFAQNQSAIPDSPNTMTSLPVSVEVTQEGQSGDGVAPHWPAGQH